MFVTAMAVDRPVKRKCIDGEGTVMTNLDQMKRSHMNHDSLNKELNCMAVSSVEGDAAGVF